MTQVENPITNVYTGPTNRISTARGISGCEHMWQADPEVRLGTLDDLIMTQLTHAHAKNKSKIVIIDFGSGESGLVLSQFVFDQGLTPKTHYFLKSHPEFSIEFLGITDAPSANLQGQETQNSTNRSIAAKVFTPQIETHNYYFSVTRVQKLSDFLQSTGIQEVDLIISTSTLTHLNPELFRDVLEDAFLRLASGGVIAASVYADDIPEVNRIKEGGYINASTSEKITEQRLLDQIEQKRAEMRHKKTAGLQSIQTKYNGIMHMQYGQSNILIKKAI